MTRFWLFNTQSACLRLEPFRIECFRISSNFGTCRQASPSDPQACIRCIPRIVLSKPSECTNCCVPPVSRAFICLPPIFSFSSIFFEPNFHCSQSLILRTPTELLQKYYQTNQKCQKKLSTTYKNYKHHYLIKISKNKK